MKNLYLDFKNEVLDFIEDSYEYTPENSQISELLKFYNLNVEKTVDVIISIYKEFLTLTDLVILIRRINSLKEKLLLIEANTSSINTNAEKNKYF